MKGFEEFEPTKELEDELLELAKETGAIKVDKRGGKREGAGRKKKDGSDPTPKKSAPKLIEKSKRNENIEPTAKGLLGNGVDNGRGRLTKSEVVRSVAEKLSDAGFDPVANMVDMVRDPEGYGLEGKDLININKELIKYVHPSQKSVEKKETKDWTINIIQKDFKLGDSGEVIEV